jgi:uncharacterized membrane protein HdeD (DUF308 family)
MSLAVLGAVAMIVGAFALLRGEIALIGKIKLRGRAARIVGTVTLLLGIALFAWVAMQGPMVGEF